MLTLGDLGKATGVKPKTLDAKLAKAQKREAALFAAGKAKKGAKAQAHVERLATKIDTRNAARDRANAVTNANAHTGTGPTDLVTNSGGTANTGSGSGGGGGGTPDYYNDTLASGDGSSLDASSGAVDTNIDSSIPVDNLAEGTDPNAINPITLPGTENPLATNAKPLNWTVIGIGVSVALFLLARRKKKRR